MLAEEKDEKRRKLITHAIEYISDPEPPRPKE
jgi:hypothetical protein